MAERESYPLQLSPTADLFNRVIALAGAGRGGLVSRCLAALERSDRKGIVYAIEKNPSAFVTSVLALCSLFTR